MAWRAWRITCSNCYLSVTRHSTKTLAPAASFWLAHGVVFFYLLQTSPILFSSHIVKQMCMRAEIKSASCEKDFLQRVSNVLFYMLPRLINGRRCLFYKVSLTTHTLSGVNSVADLSITYTTINLSFVYILTKFIPKQFSSREKLILYVSIIVVLACCTLTLNYSWKVFIVPHRMKMIHWLLIGGLLHLVPRGGDWAGSQLACSPLLAVPKQPTHERPVYQSPYCCIMD